MTRKPAAGMGAATDQEKRDEKLRKVLTEGHTTFRGFRLLFKALPSASRCRMCDAPFTGVSGKIVRPFGWRPSRKNPNFCDSCIERFAHGGVEIDVAVLFADVRGSTSLGERLGTSAFAALINRFYWVANEVLVGKDAIIDKMIGDEVMALFTPGVSGKAYRARAVEAGEALLRAVRDEKSGAAWLDVGVAVHAGPAYVGNVGGGGIVDFTALGDTVNTAARLQAAAAPGEMVISDEVFPLVSERYGDLPARTLSLKGKAETVGVRVFSVGDPAAAIENSKAKKTAG
jgi:class 3 adenylate cyclase